ncbi:hypothetical protein CDL12_10291 [Handroanthus impetiginosus]|uniref:Uncharacterized protein n=1 Tax=Handroanthus impetiginosus TaxID=429701 RepID=A0A2G9HHM4_9LAMI|nr:hypothetical protein CDL12_10291 [Handroanthus impetiginosus]
MLTPILHACHGAHQPTSCAYDQAKISPLIRITNSINRAARFTRKRKTSTTFSRYYCILKSKKMKIDDSFKKPGAVPFKWEIRPGVPKLQNSQPSSDHNHHEFEFEFQKLHQRKQQVHQKHSLNSPLPQTPSRLKPPPAGLYKPFPLEPRTHSFRSSSRVASNRFGLPSLVRPDIVSSAGCFPSPLVKRKNAKKRVGDPRPTPEPEYYSDLDVPSRWSISSRKSVSPLFSSFASYQSSPRPMSEAEWGTFGLF